MASLMETKARPVALGRGFCLGGESVGKLLPLCSDCGPGAVQQLYKSRSFSSLSHPLFSAPPHWEQGEFQRLFSFLLLILHFFFLWIISTYTFIDHILEP